jgi:O-antigen/teichoic acid export membrane protein
LAIFSKGDYLNTTPALFSKIKDKLNQYDFIKNIMVLMSGSSLALLIPFIVTPILTRFFTPDDFGLWGTYSAVVAVVAVIANGRYELTIILPKQESDAFNLFSASLIISVGVALLSLILNIFFGHWLSNTLDMPRLEPWLYFVPLAVVLIAIRQATNYWHNRNKRFDVLSAGKIVQSGSTAISNLSIGKFAYFSGGLIISTIVGQFLLAVYYLQRMKLKSLIHNINLSRMKELLIEYREFPMKSGAGIFFNILKEQAPIFLLAYYFDETIVGFYALIIRLFGVPLTLVAGSIGQVYFQKANELIERKKEIFKLFVKTTSRLALAAIAPVAALLLFGEEIFAFVFGDEWQEAGRILVIFTIYYAIRFIISSQSSLLIVFKRLTAELTFNITALVLQIASLVIGGYYQDYYLSLNLMAISGSVMYFGLGTYFMIFLRKQA